MLPKKMNQYDPSTDRSSCSQVAAAIQSFLDGKPAPLNQALDQHRLACVDCRVNYRAAIELLNALPQIPRPILPSGLTARIVRVVLEDAKATRKPAFLSARNLWWVAVAACLVLLIGLAQPWSSRGPVASLFSRQSRPPATTARNDQPPAPQFAANPADSVPLRERWEAASSALESLTKRTTEPTRKLLPGQVTSPSLNVPDQYPLAIDSAAQSLQEVRQSAATSLEPMASSARRAFSMLLREASMSSEAKSDF